MVSLPGVTNYPTALDDATSLIRLVNLAASTIGAGGVDDTATTIPVVDTSTFTNDGVAWVGTEAISYTGKTATSLTGCTRGFDGTTPAAHAAGEPIYGDPVIAARFDVLQDAIIALQTEYGKRGHHPYNVATYGAVLDNVTDDSTAIQDTIDAASAAGGGRVLIPKKAAIATTIILASDVVVELAPGAGLTWIGAEDGTMVTTPSATVMLRGGFVGPQSAIIDPGGATGAAFVLDLHSVQFCRWGGFEVIGGKATTTIVRVVADSASGTGGYESLKNCVFNNFDYISVRGTAGLGYWFEGPSTTQRVTLNHCWGFQGGDLRVGGFRFVRNTDNNMFHGPIRIRLFGNDTYGVVMNDTATPSVEAGVYANQFDDLAVATFNDGSTGRGCIILNKSKQTHILRLYNDPIAEGGQVVDNYSGSHWIQVAGPADADRMHIYSKGIVHKTPFIGNFVGSDAFGAEFSPTLSASTNNFGLLALRGSFQPTANLGGSSYGLYSDPTLTGVEGSTTEGITTFAGIHSRVSIGASFDANIGTIVNYLAENVVKSGGGAVFNAIGLWLQTPVAGTTRNAAVNVGNTLPAAGNWAIYASNPNPSLFSGDVQLADGKNLVVNSTTGTKIGTAATQKLGFFNATPVVRPAGIGAAATDLATVITLANNLRTALIALGLVAA